ncbi:MAG: glycosyltransferase family 2 protein [Planctomycetes bacterium]|nr:glycosyltransferase family 2 protein [Planctomycetota bacterium]
MADGSARRTRRTDARRTAGPRVGRLLEAAVAIVPAFDEASTVGEVVRALCALPIPLRVVVVDDGSRDGTGEVALAAGAELVTHVRRRGNGAAIKSGLAATVEPLVVIVDADGQHEPRLVPALLDVLRAGHDLAVACRPGFGGSGPLRGLGNRVLAALASYMTRASVPDLTSGLRAFRRAPMTPFVPLFPDGFSTPTTSTLGMLHALRRVRFVAQPGAAPVRRGRSRTRLLSDGTRFLAILLKVTLRFRPERALGPLLVSALAGVSCVLAGGGGRLALGAACVPPLACLLDGWRRAHRGARDLDVLVPCDTVHDAASDARRSPVTGRRAQPLSDAATNP